MSKIYADTVEPSVPTKDITLGATGDSITISGNSINTNVIQDSGGNVLFQSDGSGTLSNVNSAFSNNLKLLSTQTASGASSVSFTSGIDSTYDVYIFKFINMNPSNNGDGFQVNFSSDGGSNYNMTKTTTAFESSHYENNSNAYLSYSTGEDLAQSTAYQQLIPSLGNGADECCDGELYLFNPSSTTYVKQFYARTNGYIYVAMSREFYAAGYVNSTSAVNAIDFKMSSGNVMDGIIKMYGL